MTRLLEVIVAIIMVIVLAIVVGVLMPSHGHVERSLTISHNIQHAYDVLNNFRRFPDYSAWRVYEPDTTFTLSGADFGTGAKIAWHGTSPRVGDGSMEIVSSDPQTREIVWALTNDWRGEDKKFTIDISPSDNQKLVDINMAYDVDYGWNLVSRYSQLYLHGDPSTFMQYSLGDLQTLLANVPNQSYADLNPRLVDTPAQPVLLVSTHATRSLEAVAAATDNALQQIDAAMKRLGVTQTGPRITVTTDYGDTDYSFDVAVPINTEVLTLDGKTVDLKDVPKAKSFAEQNVENADEPADASSTAAPATTDGFGAFQSDGTMVVDAHVHGALMFGGRALATTLDQVSPAVLPLARLELKAYASTHGYAFNEFVGRLYDVLQSGDGAAPGDMQSFVVYLPVTDAPAETPYQAENPAAAGSAATPATAGSVGTAASTPAPAGTAPAPASSAATN